MVSIPQIPVEIPLSDLKIIWRDEYSYHLDPAARPAVDAAAAAVAIYAGITGFGKLA